MEPERNNNNKQKGNGKGNKKQGNNKQSNPDIVIESYETPRFDVTDPDGYKYLEDNGFVVFKGVANDEEIQTGIGLAWDYLERLLTGVHRNDPKTWSHAFWPDPFNKGIITGDAVGQCAFLWFCRSIPNVRRIYANIWGKEDLATSFDGFCIHRPFEYNEAWKTKEGWYHLDQNGITNSPDRVCVQGFLNFYPAGVDDGGLVVIPKSHLIFNDIFRELPHLANVGDFVRLDSQRAFWSGLYKQHKLKPLKVCAHAGDFVLWDSRTIHCNASARTARPLPTNGTCLPPRRLVAYVCMTPAERLTDEIIAKRISAYKTGQTTSHWPELCFTPRLRKNSKGDSYIPIQLTEQQEALIPMVRK